MREAFRLAIGATVATAVLTIVLGIAGAVGALQDQIPSTPVAWSLVLGVALLLLARAGIGGNPYAYMLALGLAMLEFCRGTFAALEAGSYTVEVIRAALILMMLPGILAVRQMEGNRRKPGDVSSDESEASEEDEAPRSRAPDLERASEDDAPSLESAYDRQAIPPPRRRRVWVFIAILGFIGCGLAALLGMIVADCDPRSQSAIQLGCIFDRSSRHAQTEWLPYTGGHLGFKFSHPADWTVFESPAFISVTRNDRRAEVSFGWMPRLEGETNAEFMARYAATTAAFYSEVEMTTRPHEGGDPIEVLMTGLDEEGTRWIIDLVVSGASPRVFTVQSLAQEDSLEEAQPIFDGVIQSLEIIEN